MFCKATLFTLALAFVASASPVEVDSGIRVALPKRSSLTRADGTFDHAKAVTESAKTVNKHRQNLINLQRNTGSLPQVRADADFVLSYPEFCRDA
jgi:cathepsin D